MSFFFISELKMSLSSPLKYYFGFIIFGGFILDFLIRRIIVVVFFFLLNTTSSPLKHQIAFIIF
jgi:hypothetical protein